MDISITEWWVVYGANLPTPQTFYNEEEALAAYERLCHDDWVTDASVVRHNVIRKMERLPRK